MILENEWLRLKVQPQGGEISSLLYKKKNLEVMWQGDENHWKGKNPTLFPIVGNTWSQDYQIGGKTYAMKNHGLIRYATLQCVLENEHEIIMELKSDETTREQYPFDFTYQIRYTLDQNVVHVDYTITNDSKTEMPFTLGLHPGFNVRNFDTSVLEYCEDENATQLHILNGYSEEKVQLKQWHLNHQEIVKEGTLVYKDLKSPFVDLKMDEYTLRMSIAGYPFFAVWTSDETASFLCLEPWYGHGDFVESNVAFEKREGMMQLKPNEVFKCEYWFEINENKGDK